MAYGQTGALQTAPVARSLRVNLQANSFPGDLSQTRNSRVMHGIRPGNGSRAFFEGAALRPTGSEIIKRRGPGTRCPAIILRDAALRGHYLGTNAFDVSGCALMAEGV